MFIIENYVITFKIIKIIGAGTYLSNFFLGLLSGLSLKTS